MTTVVITRQRHPLQGHSLAMLGQMRRHGQLQLLLVLPDGSKSLVPAAWTDLGEQNTIATAAATLGSLHDLLHASAALAALSTRGCSAQDQAARQSPSKEDSRAACAAKSAAGPGSGATPRSSRPAAPAAGHSGDHAACPPDRQNSRGRGDGGGR